MEDRSSPFSTLAALFPFLRSTHSSSFSLLLLAILTFLAYPNCYTRGPGDERTKRTLRRTSLGILATPKKKYWNHVHFTEHLNTYMFLFYFLSLNFEISSTLWFVLPITFEIKTRYARSFCAETLNRYFLSLVPLFMRLNISVNFAIFFS